MQHVIPCQAIAKLQRLPMTARRPSSVRIGGWISSEFHIDTAGGRVTSRQVRQPVIDESTTVALQQTATSRPAGASRGRHLRAELTLLCNDFVSLWMLRVNGEPRQYNSGLRGSLLKENQCNDGTYKILKPSENATGYSLRC